MALAPSSSCPPTSLPSPSLCSHSICCSSWLGSPSVGTAEKENGVVYFYPKILLVAGRRGAPSDQGAAVPVAVGRSGGGGRPRSTPGRSRFQTTDTSRRSSTGPRAGSSEWHHQELLCDHRQAHLSGPPFSPLKGGMQALPAPFL